MACYDHENQKFDAIAYMTKKADRATCPRRPDFSRLYEAYNKEMYGERNGGAMFDKLEETLKEYKVKWKEASLKYQEYEEIDGTIITPFILVVITEQMKRVHLLVSIYISI